MTYDKKEAYDNDLRPLIKQILLICDREKIPVFMSFAVKNDDEGTEYEAELLSAPSQGHRLTDDLLTQYAMVQNGAKVVPRAVYPKLENYNL